MPVVATEGQPMNVPPPPPGHGDLKFKVESGDPIIVRVTYQGANYVIRLSQSILAVWPAIGMTDPTGMPIFNVQAAPTMTVSKEPQKS